LKVPQVHCKLNDTTTTQGESYPSVYPSVETRNYCAMECISKIGTPPTGMALDRHWGLYRVSRLACRTYTGHDWHKPRWLIAFLSREKAYLSNLVYVRRRCVYEHLIQASGCFVQLWGESDIAEVSFSVHALCFALLTMQSPLEFLERRMFNLNGINSRQFSFLVICNLILPKYCIAFRETELDARKSHIIEIVKISSI